MKKITLMLALLLGLVACGSNNDGNDNQEPDVNTVASISGDASVIRESLGKEGNWITAATADITFDSELVVTGTFNDKGDTANAVYRKLALHTQDESYNIIDNFTLTAPSVVVESENFTVFYGTIKGDVYVNANGFALQGTVVEGNIIFGNQEYHDSSDLNKEDAGASVLGDIVINE